MEIQDLQDNQDPRDNLAHKDLQALKEILVLRDPEEIMEVQVRNSNFYNLICLDLI